MTSSQVYGDQDNFEHWDIDKLKKNATRIHPAGLYYLTSKLLHANQKDEAVMWFYVAQLRFRFHLAANPDLDPSGDPALFASFHEVFGNAINGYAGGDPDLWAASIKKAGQWDQSHDNLYTSKKKNRKAYEEVRAGMEALITHIENHKDEIRKHREQNGLDNR